MRTARVLRLALLIVLAGSRTAPSAAQTFEQVGTRALGMGGAFVAIADDASAIYWNPAGLANGALVSLVGEWGENRTWTDRRQHALPAASAGAVLVGFGTPSLGLAYYRLRTSAVIPRTPEGESDPARQDPGGTVSLDGLVTRHAALALVQPVLPGVSLGTVLKYVRGAAARRLGEPGAVAMALLEEAEHLEGRADGVFDLDLGLMAVAGSLRIGVVARNLRTPTFASPEGPAVELKRQVRTGLAWAADNGLTVAADLDVTKGDTVFGRRRMLALGAQQRLGGWLAVRGGGRFNLEEGDGDPTGGFGVSVALDSTFWVDAQLTRGGPRSADRGWGVSGRLGF